MKFNLFLLFVTVFLNIVTSECVENNEEIIEYKHNLKQNKNLVFPRKKRQSRRFFGNNFQNEDEEEWYIFDSDDSYQKNINPPVILHKSTFKPIIRTTERPRPVIPNAGPPRLPPCEENCNARTTSQYNPICGTNGVTYFNIARFHCAVFCGQKIDIRIMGRCAPFLP